MSYKKMVIALGGNALQAANGPATAEAQLAIVRESMHALAPLIAAGHTVVITHGNGPQVGRLLIQNELAAEQTPAMPFDVCGAMSQGMIGYHLQQALTYELAVLDSPKTVVSLLTQVVVDGKDAGFINPTKPIGPFFTAEQAEKLTAERGYVMKEDAGRGYRRVVASPAPLKIVELAAIEALVKAGQVVIACGGGGVPVVEGATAGLYTGVAAVIDKDLTSAHLAQELEADLLIILTAVPKVAVQFGKPDQCDLDRLSVSEAEAYMNEGQFGVGSMLPKVQAACQFVRSAAGKKAIITSLEAVGLALEGKAGTVIS